jgi:hypothetical protein
MDQFIQVYKKAFNDEFCNRVIECYNTAEKSGITLNRQEHDRVPKTEKQDTAIYLPHFPLEHTDKEIVNEFNHVSGVNVINNMQISLIY